MIVGGVSFKKRRSYFTKVVITRERLIMAYIRIIYKNISKISKIYISKYVILEIIGNYCLVKMASIDFFG